MTAAPDRNATLAEWLAFRGLPAHLTLTELIEHERVSARLAGTFHDMSTDPRNHDRMDALRLHLKLVHRNEAALDLINSEAVDQHDHEHNGPGGLRNHDQPEQLHD